MWVAKFNKTYSPVQDQAHLLAYIGEKNCIAFLPSHHEETSSQKVAYNLTRLVFIRYDIHAIIMTGKELQLDLHWFNCSKKKSVIQAYYINIRH